LWLLVKDSFFIINIYEGLTAGSKDRFSPLPGLADAGNTLTVKRKIQADAEVQEPIRSGYSEIPDGDG
jgi:hypothetical protein